MISMEPNDIKVNYRNRFIVEFDDKFKIPNYAISTTDLPKLKKAKTSLALEWGEIELLLIDVISVNIVESILELSKPENRDFNFEINQLNMTGGTTNKWVITKCQIQSIDFSYKPLTYFEDGDDKNNVNFIRLVVKPGDCKSVFLTN